MKEGRTHIQFEDITQRFGLVEKSHRIGEIDIKVAQVKRVDEMVSELSPAAVTTYGDAPVWMITWPPAFGLAEYLLLNQPGKKLRALKLGCGTAAPGIALAKAGARVTCTDYDHLALAMARHNARLNGCSSLTTCFLDWHQPNLEGSFDLIIGSEVIYFEKSFRPLLAVLKRYLTPNGLIVLSDQWRIQMMSFLELCAAEGFTSHQFSQTVYLPDHNQPIRITIV